MTTTIDLGAHFEDFVAQQVSSGRFNTTSEVICAGLRLLQDQEQLQALKLQALRSNIAAGINSGPGRDADAVFDRLKKKNKKKAATTKRGS